MKVKDENTNSMTIREEMSIICFENMITYKGKKKKRIPMNLLPQSNRTSNGSSPKWKVRRMALKTNNTFCTT